MQIQVRPERTLLALLVSIPADHRSVRESLQ